MKKHTIVFILLAIIAFLFVVKIANGDVTVPSSAEPRYSGLDFERNHIYKLRDLYLADDSGNTMQVGAQALSDDTTIFLFPSDNGTNAYCLKTDGAGNTYWATCTDIDVMTTRGDIIYRNSSNATDRLPVGAANSLFTSDGTDPSWSANPTVTTLTAATSIKSDDIYDEAGTGAPTTPNGIQVDDAAGQEILNYYDKTSISGTGSSCTYSGRATRIGEVVTIYVDFTITNASAATCTESAIIPSAFRPTNYNASNIFRYAYDQYLAFEVETDGDITLYSMSPAAGTSKTFGGTWTRKATITFLRD